MERTPQSEIDQTFCGLMNIDRDELVKSSEFYEHLKHQGYTDDEIRNVFDLEINNGEVYEV